MGRRIVFAVVALGLAGVVMAGQAHFDLSGLGAAKLTMRGHYDDEKTDATYTTSRETCDAKPCLHVVWSSRVKQIDMFLWPDGRPIRTRYRKPADRLDVKIDYTPPGAVYRYQRGDEVERHVIEQPGLLETLSIDVLFVAYPFEQGGEKTFYGIDSDSEDGDVYEFWVERDEVETLSIAGERVRAYKLKMSIKGFVGLFAPNYYFWYSVDAPHRYLKYSGPDEAFARISGDLAL